MTTPVTKSGFEYQHADRTMKMMRHSTAKFKAPFTLIYNGVFETKPEPKYFNLTTIGIPTKPGWNRLIVLSTMQNQKQESEDTKEKPTKNKKTRLRVKLLSVIPLCLVHLLSNRFLDSDLALLHYQEQERERLGGDDNENKRGVYFLPSPADRSVNAFRKWKNTYASVLLPLPPPIQSRAVIFDRYTQHTDQCRHCNKALQQVKSIRVRIVAVLALGGILAVTRFPVLGAIVVAGCLATIMLLNAMEEAFNKGDFRHYEND